MSYTTFFHDSLLTVGVGAEGGTNPMWDLRGTNFQISLSSTPLMRSSCLLPIANPTNTLHGGTKKSQKGQLTLHLQPCASAPAGTIDIGGDFARCAPFALTVLTLPSLFLPSPRKGPASKMHRQPFPQSTLHKTEDANSTSTKMTRVSSVHDMNAPVSKESLCFIPSKNRGRESQEGTQPLPSRVHDWS